MTRVVDYRETLRATAPPRPPLGRAPRTGRALGSDWESFLRAQSRLPGPRANLELAQAAALEGDADRLAALRGSPDEFLTTCGVIGLGRVVGVDELRPWAADPRWRVPEAVAMALACGWSVAVAALPGPGRAAMVRWIAAGDAATRRIMGENRRTSRLARLDRAWVERRLARI
jgi:hypothetical protein